MAFEDVEELRSPGLDNREWCLVQNSDTSTDIYGELQNTAERFKELADRLQRTAPRKDLTNEKAVQTFGCCEVTRTKLMECIAENLRLRQSLKEVSDINHRWQDYNYDRQKHVQRLLSTVSELRTTIEAMKEFRKSPSVSPKENEKNESDDQFPLELRWTADTVKHQSRKSSSATPKKSERNEYEKEARRTVSVMQQQTRKSSSASPKKSERNDAADDDLSPSESRAKVDAAKQQSRKSSSILPKESESDESHDQPALQLRRKADVVKQQSKKSSSMLPEESEMNELNNQTALLNDKLSDEVRVLSMQLKDVRNESKAAKEQLEKVLEENEALRDQLKTYRSDWENENRKKLEALSQAQSVVQELCALKVNCQKQAERLMKLSTVSFNCSLCQGIQSGQAVNNLSVSSQLEHNGRAKNKEKRREVTRSAAAIIQSVDGVEVHLRERGTIGATDEGRTDCISHKMTSEEKLSDSTSPIVTFPDSDSEEQTATEKPSIRLATASQHLVCPVCSASFLKEHGSQFLDHYTNCKLSPGKHFS